MNDLVPARQISRQRSSKQLQVVEDDEQSRLNNAGENIRKGKRKEDWPSPEEVRDFEAVQAGYGERIIKISEDELAHKRDMERRYASHAMMGPLLYFSLLFASLAGGIFLVQSNHEIAGTILCGVIAISLVGFLLKGQLRSIWSDRSSQGNARIWRQK